MGSASTQNLMPIHAATPPTMRLVPFDRSHAAEVLSWLRTPAELAHWAALVEPPTPAIFEKWLADPTSHGRLLISDAPLAYGELWVSESEDEVELAHILVSPHHRNRGVGRKLVQLLVDEATGFHVSTVWVRVVPENQAAIRCYRAGGFAPVPHDQQAELNAKQPRTYCWLSRHLRNT